MGRILIRWKNGRGEFVIQDTDSLVAKYGQILADAQGGWFCHYCHLPVRRASLEHQEALISKGFGVATIDHKQAKRDGGEDALSNYVLCCYKCNQEKDVMSYANFYNKTHKRRMKRKRKQRFQ